MFTTMVKKVDEGEISVNDNGGGFKEVPIPDDQ